MGTRGHVGARLGARVRLWWRVIAFALTAALAISVAQVVVWPSAASARPSEVPRDLPILSVQSKDKPSQAPDPKQPKADFTPLAGKHTRSDGRRSAQDTGGAPETSLV